MQVPNLKLGMAFFIIEYNLNRESDLEGEFFRISSLLKFVEETI